MANKCFDSRANMAHQHPVIGRTHAVHELLQCRRTTVWSLGPFGPLAAAHARSLPGPGSQLIRCMHGRLKSPRHQLASSSISRLGCHDVADSWAIRQQLRLESSIGVLYYHSAWHATIFQHCPRKGDRRNYPNRPRTDRRRRPCSLVGNHACQAGERELGASQSLVSSPVGIPAVLLQRQETGNPPALVPATARVRPFLQETDQAVPGQPQGHRAGC